jgi:Fur family zinc uptake transcriptional regulator
MLQTSETSQTSYDNPQAFPSDGSMPKLTGNEKKVFYALDDLNRAAGAYELLDLLRPEGVNAIPTVYRALNGLMKKGLVRHITSTRTYVTLSDVLEEEDDERVFLVCSSCQNVDAIKASDTLDALRLNAKKTKFSVQAKHLEFLGLCYSCTEKASEGENA